MICYKKDDVCKHRKKGVAKKTETIIVPYLHYNTKWKEWMIFYLNSNDEWSLEAFADRTSAEREKDLIIRNSFERGISLPGIQKYSEGSYVLCFFD